MWIKVHGELGKLGLDVIGDASNGKEALEIYEKEKPDIVMTDIKMPVMDGLELIEKYGNRIRAPGLSY
mgnify:CR=1 FL=1